MAAEASSDFATIKAGPLGVMQVEKGLFLESLGGEEAARKLDPEAKADAIEDFLANQLKAAGAPVGDSANGDKHYPTAAQVEERIETRPYRMGAGFLFVSHNGNVKKLPRMPAKPPLVDYFDLRFGAGTTRNHCLQSATLAMKNGMTEEIILACLLHDTAAELMRSDHGWW